ncbi:MULTISPECIES: TOBE domain-containing protein [Mycobacterium]|uniref:Molybdenum-binding protein n=1 Tax=Mycobacterium gordonae TaxID=1778 RepID=A0A1X1WYK8_MYCGO|nr:MULTISPECIES: TOBE domain-containing protein [Mycobacterium]MBI2700935.1 TOBE domain-containing protein [Mycobacterium sp.]MBX9982311.1 TOBE domain-containing protein [Mycobacterium gordonae]MCQ4361661.1 TOBE domain-containing protein [Mycobacterium gordonae]MCV7006469.1 TOBE domain-containing protein [Mycobacterium gordonae]ODR17063.1 molybdenum-binding protein [Mycobacterium gordonae]
MRLSTRNQLQGTITEVNIGTVMAIVKIRLDGGDQIVTSSITKDAALDLGLEVGRPATVFIKSTEVTIGVD